MSLSGDAGLIFTNASIIVSHTQTPWVNHPGNQPEANAGHRTVNIRCGRGSVSIKCGSRKQAERLGSALIGLFREACQHKPESNDSEK